MLRSYVEFTIWVTIDMTGLTLENMDRTGSRAAGLFEGKFLLAMPSLDSSVFKRSVIFICAHSSDGAMGFQVNKPCEMTIADLIRKTDLDSEFDFNYKNSVYADAQVQSGGPVEQQRGFVLHSYDYETDTTIAINDAIYLTSNVEILRAIVTGEGPESMVVALGYAGWGPGQLEQEIAENAWLTFDADQETIFNPIHEAKYDQLLAQMGIDPVHLTGNGGSA